MKGVNSNYGYVVSIVINWTEVTGIGASRIVAGSDECYFPLEEKMDIINLAIYSDEDKKLILGGNLQKFLNIK